MAEGFNVGDVVQLKSGGPKMTVIEVGRSPITSEATIHCTWFAGARSERAVFPPDALVSAPEDKPKK
jgi:uncharacterized protein YodC (DUF2158 family)